MKTLILDGNNAAWRLQKVLPELTSRRQPIQVIYGFLRLLRSALEKFEPNVALVCWDLGRSRHRLKLYKDYKAHRDHYKTPELKKEYEDLNRQMKTLKNLLTLVNVAQVAYPDTEADDLMGIAVSALRGHKTIITSDQDALHLVDEDVDVWSPIKEILYTNSNFYKRVGLSPQQWLEYRALVGDKGDNIPGIAKGFGEETAKTLISKYGSLGMLFTPGVMKKVSRKGNRYALLYSEGTQQRSYLNLLLMDLRLSIARSDGGKIATLIEKNWKARRKVDKVELREYFIGHQFKTLLEDLPKWIQPFENLDT